MKNAPAFRVIRMSDLCNRCKGKGLCGRPFCPILARFRKAGKIAGSLENATEVFGPSPPAVFVGSYNYPDLSAGPLIPPAVDPEVIFSDASEALRKKAEKGPSFLEDSREWHDLSMQDIITMRSSLVRANSHFRPTDALPDTLAGSRRTSAVPDHKPKNPLLVKAQELALSAKPVDTEAWFRKPLIPELRFDSLMMPMGPSGQVRDFRITESPKVPQKVDYLVYDTDASAKDVVLELFSGNVSSEQITRLMSIGLLGRERRLVPTRWSITAVDDMEGKALISRIRDYPHLRDIMVFSGNFMGNYFEILLLPGSFSYEMLELWMPQAVWSGDRTIIAQDAEDFYGKKEYSTLTGGYYAARLPILEYLEKIRRQAFVFVLREIRPEYCAPLGVWVVREASRISMDNPYETFQTKEDALAAMAKRIITPRNDWEAATKKLHDQKIQSRLDSFF